MHTSVVGAAGREPGVTRGTENRHWPVAVNRRASCLEPQYGNPVWHGPEATGTVSRIAEDRVRFVGSKGQSAEFRPSDAGEEVGLCG